MMPFLLIGFKKIFSTAKKIFLVVAVFTIVISLFSHFINKDRSNLQTETDPIKQNRAEFYKIINDKKLNSTKEGKITIAFYRSYLCKTIGEACINNPNDTENNYQKSTLGFLAKFIKVPYNPPASGVIWAYEGLQNAGFVPKSMASEGIGFSAIKPFSDIWKLFRDISYMLLVIFLMVIGFMIMFRAKLNPQTVISVENALPKIVIALILITFSFAIAGFLIDLMYIVTSVMISVLSKNDTYFVSTDFKNQYLLSSVWDIWIRDVRLRLPISVNLSGFFTSALLKVLPAQIDVALRTLVGGIVVLLSNNLVAPLVKVIGEALNGAWGSWPSVLLTPVAYFLVWVPIFMWGFLHALELILTLLMFFSFVFLTFRISVLLFTSYLKLIILIILGPLLLLLFESLGKSAFKYWLTNIIGTLIPFPVTILIFTIGYLIYTQANDIGITGRLPYLYGIEASGFKFLIGLGLIFLIPDIVKIVKEALGIKDVPLNIGIGTFFGGVTAGVGGATGILGQYGSLALAVNYLPGGKRLLSKISPDITAPGGGQKTERTDLKGGVEGKKS